jgi:hypothetical protein
VRHDREGESDDVDPAPEHALGEVRRERRIAEHDRNDRMLAGQQIETQPCIPARKCAALRVHALAQVGELLEQIEHPDRRGGHRRRDAVGEQIRPRSLAQPARRFPCARRRKPPLAPPKALPKVPVRMSIRPMTPRARACRGRARR